LKFEPNNELVKQYQEVLKEKIQQGIQSFDPTLRPTKDKNEKENGLSDEEYSDDSDSQ
jgi:hypothetical protein